MSLRTYYAQKILELWRADDRDISNHLRTLHSDKIKRKNNCTIEFPKEDGYLDEQCYPYCL